MTGANWSPAILMLALALSLAVTPARYLLLALIAMMAGAILAMIPNYPASWQKPVVAWSWLSIIVTALAVYRKPDASPHSALLLAINAGICAGAVTANFGTARDVLMVLPLALLTYPARWICNRGWSIALKILASWLVAIALLIAALPLVETPGYVQDHMQ